MFIGVFKALPFGEGAPEGGGRGAEKRCILTHIYANSYSLHTSSVAPLARHLPQRGRLNLPAKLEFE